MKSKEKPKAKLQVIKNEEFSEDKREISNEEETNRKKPSQEEIAQYKDDFEKALKEFMDMRFLISEPNQFSSNETALFLIDYLKKYALWTKTGWMGIIKMHEILNQELNKDNEKTGLCLDYQSLEFCGYMLMNPGATGYDKALEFEKIADKYSQIMIKVGQKIDEAREILKKVQYLQDKWSAAEQGYYLAELEPKDENPKDEQGEDKNPENNEEENKEEPPTNNA